MSPLWLIITAVFLLVIGVICFFAGRHFSRKSTDDWTKHAQAEIVNTASIAFGHGSREIPPTYGVAWAELSNLLYFLSGASFTAGAAVLVVLLTKL